MRRKDDAVELVKTGHPPKFRDDRKNKLKYLLVRFKSGSAKDETVRSLNLR